MFDLRYHVASLAAVFLMLVVGILIGVGISGRGFVDDAERNSFEREIAGLKEDVDAANESADDFERRQQAAEEFVESAYPALAAKRLDGKNVAILVLGPVDPSVSAIERAVEEDADGRVSRMRALELPLRLEAVEAALSEKPELGGYVGDDQLGNLGRDLGRELAAGGETPLWDALESELVEVREGGLADPVDGVIVMRTAEPQAGESSRFLAGLYQGLGSAGVPVVGRRADPRRAERDPCLPAPPALDRGRHRHARRRAGRAARARRSRRRRRLRRPRHRRPDPAADRAAHAAEWLSR